MVRKIYSLDKENKQVLEINWKGSFKNVEVKINNKPAGAFNNKNELRQGKEFDVGNGNKLKVHLVKSFYILEELELLINGQPMEGSITHPLKRLNAIFQIILFIAIVNCILGVLSLLIDTSFLKNFGVGYWNIIYAGIFILLGIFIKEKKSMVAMVTILVLMVLDIISTVMFYAEYQDASNISGALIIKTIFTLFLIRGIPAIKRFRQMEIHKEQLRKKEEAEKSKTSLSELKTDDHTPFMPKDHSDYLPKQ